MSGFWKRVFAPIFLKHYHDIAAFIPEDAPDQAEGGDGFIGVDFLPIGLIF
jgi:hypothetical protein